MIFTVSFRTYQILIFIKSGSIKAQLISIPSASTFSQKENVPPPLIKLSREHVETRSNGLSLFEMQDTATWRNVTDAAGIQTRYEHHFSRYQH